MPIIATPRSTVISATACDPFDNPGGLSPIVPITNCLGQRIILPQNPVDGGTGEAVPGRVRTVLVTGGAAASLQWRMLDPDGSLVDMTSCNCASLAPEACPYSFALLLSEYWGCEALDTIPATLNAQTSVITADIPKASLDRPGVYWAEMVMYFTDLQTNVKRAVFSNQFYMLIGKSLLQANDQPLMGPPSVAEIRAYLRDSGSAESYLLDQFKFDDTEIALATYLPVQLWNETPPPVAYFNTQSFPYRYHWLQAITGQLMLMAAEQQRVNQLQYSAGGLTINDNNREANYTTEGRYRMDEFKRWMQSKKVEINIGYAFGSSSSPYSSNRWW